MTKVNRGAVKRILGVEVEVTDEILRCVIDGLPLLAGPFKVERRMYDLSPATDFNREVERRPQDVKIFNRSSPRFFQKFELT